MKKNTLKNLFIIGACMLATIFIVCMIGWVSKGTFDFSNTEDWSLLEVNEDNLLDAEKYTIKTLNTGLGYGIEVNEYGQIKVSGTNNSGEAQTHEVQEVTLPAGTYTLSSGAKGTSIAGYNMSIVVGDATYYADFGSNTTFTVASETEATINIYINDKVEINQTFSPVLVAGEDEGDFFKVGSGK